MSKESALFKNATRVHVVEINGSNKLRVVNRRDIVKRSIREIEEFLVHKEQMRLMIEEQQKTMELIERGKIRARKIELEAGYDRTKLKPTYKPFKKVKPQDLHDKNEQTTTTKPVSTDSRSESRQKAKQLSSKKQK